MNSLGLANVLARLEWLHSDLHAFTVAARASLADPTLPKAERPYWEAKETAYGLACAGLRAIIAAIESGSCDE